MRPEALHSSIVVFVAVVALLLSAALPAIAVAQVMHPRRVTRDTRTVRTVATVPVTALPMLWACVGFVLLLSPECFVVPAFGEDVLWVWDREMPVSDDSFARGSWTPCPSFGSPNQSAQIADERSSLTCGPLTFGLRRFQSDGSQLVTWDPAGWSCSPRDLSARPTPFGLWMWASSDRSFVRYECRALDNASNPGRYFVAPARPLVVRPWREPRGPGQELPPAVALFAASVAIAAAALALLQRADRRARRWIFVADAPSTDEAVDDPDALAPTPFRSARLVEPTAPLRRDPRRATFERGLRWRWCVTAALTGSLALITHHGHVPGRPLVTTRDAAPTP